MNATLQEVSAHIQAGITPPPLQRFRGLTRLLAAGLARCIQFLARPVTTEQRAFNLAAFDALQQFDDRLQRLEQGRAETVAALQAEARRGDELFRQHEGFDAILAQHGIRLEQLEAASHSTHASLVRAEAALNQMEAVLHRSEAVLQRQCALVEKCEAGLDEQGTAGSQLQERQDLLSQGLEALRVEVSPLRERMARLQTDLLLHQRKLGAVMEEWRRSPSPHTDAAPAGMDQLYASFEDQFRGSRDDITSRLKPYLPLLLDRNLGGESSPVLDLGCGRGEWLELLRDNGLHARGIDLNEIFLEECRERGLEVAAGDALEQLRAQPDASLGAVTAFHLVEHLPFAYLLELIDEVVRVLKPGGLALFETPNPENLLVSTCFFYADPTHRNPLFAPTLQFLAEQRGLARVEVRPMNAHLLHGLLGDGVAHLSPESHPLLSILKRHLTAAPDFALVGWKA